MKSTTGLMPKAGLRHSRRDFLKMAGLGVSAAALIHPLPAMSGSVEIGAADCVLPFFRPEDLFYGQLELYNLRLDRVSGLLVRRSSAHPALIALVLPPQHIVEDSGFPDSKAADGSREYAAPLRVKGPVAARMSGSSRLVFVVPVPISDAGIAPRLDALLAVARETQVRPADCIASLPTTGIASYTPKAPGNTETWIEWPNRLILAPAAGSRFFHAARPLSRIQEYYGKPWRWTELWHTGLDLSLPRERRPLWPPTLAIAVPPESQVETRDELLKGPVSREDDPRGLLYPIHLREKGRPLPPQTARVDGNPVDFGPPDWALEGGRDQMALGDGVLRTRLLLLSSLGASCDVEYRSMLNLPALPAGAAEGSSFGLRQWVQRAVIGRDNYIKVVRNGYLFPYQHRAVYVEIRERKLVKAHPDPKSDTDDANTGAYMLRRQFIVVLEPEKQLPAEDGTGNRGADYLAREQHLAWVRIKEERTPNLRNPKEADDKSDEVFWPREQDRVWPSDQKDKEVYRFHCEVRDRNGRFSEMEIPMLFTISQDKGAAKYSEANAELRTARFFGASLGFVAESPVPFKPEALTPELLALFEKPLGDGAAAGATTLRQELTGNSERSARLFEELKEVVERGPAEPMARTTLIEAHLNALFGGNELFPATLLRAVQEAFLDLLPVPADYPSVIDRSGAEAVLQPFYRLAEQLSAAGMAPILSPAEAKALKDQTDIIRNAAVELWRNLSKESLEKKKLPEEVRREAVSGVFRHLADEFAREVSERLRKEADAYVVTRETHASSEADRVARLCRQLGEALCSASDFTLRPKDAKPRLDPEIAQRLDTLGQEWQERRVTLQLRLARHLERLSARLDALPDTLEAIAPLDVSVRNLVAAWKLGDQKTETETVLRDLRDNCWVLANKLCQAPGAARLKQVLLSSALRDAAVSGLPDLLSRAARAGQGGVSDQDKQAAHQALEEMIRRLQATTPQSVEALLPDVQMLAQAGLLKAQELLGEINRENPIDQSLARARLLDMAKALLGETSEAGPRVRAQFLDLLDQRALAEATRRLQQYSARSLDELRPAVDALKEAGLAQAQSLREQLDSLGLPAALAAFRDQVAAALRDETEAGRKVRSQLLDQLGRQRNILGVLAGAQFPAASPEPALLTHEVTYALNRAVLRHGTAGLQQWERFLPRYEQAVVEVPAFKRVAPGVQKVVLKPFEDYVQEGFARIQDGAVVGLRQGVYAQLATPLANIGGQIPAGVLAPALQFAGLSRDIGGVIGDGESALRQVAGQAQRGLNVLRVEAGERLTQLESFNEKLSDDVKKEFAALVKQARDTIEALKKAANSSWDEHRGTLEQAVAVARKNLLDGKAGAEAALRVADRNLQEFTDKVSSLEGVLRQAQEKTDRLVWQGRRQAEALLRQGLEVRGATMEELRGVVEGARSGLALMHKSLESVAKNTADNLQKQIAAALEEARKALNQGIDTELRRLTESIPALRRQWETAVGQAREELRQRLAVAQQRVEAINNELRRFRAKVDEIAAECDELRRQIASIPGKLDELVKGAEQQARDYAEKSRKRAAEWAQAQAKELNVGSWLPNVKLLGSLNLSQLLAAINDFSKLPQIVSRELPDRVETTWHWESPLQKKSFGVVKFEPGPGRCQVRLDSRTVQRLPTLDRRTVSPPEMQVRGELDPFRIELASCIGIRLARLNFETGTSLPTRVVPKGLAVEFLGPLAFVAKLQALLAKLTGVKGLRLKITSSEVEVGLSLALPALTFGVFSLSGIRFITGLSLPLGSGRMGYVFSFCDRANKFLLTISGFAGAGYLELKVYSDGERSVEGALEFGGALEFSFGGVAEGRLYIMAGIFFRITRASSEGFGYLRAGGHLNVLGLIEASIEIVLGLHYQRTGSQTYFHGRGSVTVCVKLMFFSKKVTIGFERRFAGSKGGASGRSETGQAQVSSSGFGGEALLAQHRHGSVDLWDAEHRRQNWLPYGDHTGPLAPSPASPPAENPWTKLTRTTRITREAWRQYWGAFA